MADFKHEKLAADLRRRILAGEWDVGERLPPEIDLAARMGASRATLRQALDGLRANGLIDRRRGRGTTVLSRDPGGKYPMITAGLDDVLSLGRDTMMQIDRTRHVADGTIDELDGLSSSTGYWLEVTGQRRIEGQAFAFNWSQVWVSGLYAGIEPALGPSAASVFGVVERLFSVAPARVRQDVSALPCPACAARAMGLPPASPVIGIQARLFDAAGGLIEVSHALFDPARFQVSTDVDLS